MTCHNWTLGLSGVISVTGHVYRSVFLSSGKTIKDYLFKILYL